MTITRQPVTRSTSESAKFKPSVILALFLGLLGAVLSFSQAAASIGVALENFRPLGGMFFSWSSGQRSLALSLYEGDKKIPARRLLDAGRTGLGYAPLSARSMWLVGKGFEAQGRIGDARKAMKRAERISRRDGSVQLWLADDELRRGLVASSLRHYDLIIRAEPRAADQIVVRLAAIMTAPQGRRYLQPYIRQDNAWLPALLGTAVTSLPKAEPVGLLFTERKGKAPALPELDPVYEKLVSRLVAEGSQDVALRLYPLLPRGSSAALTNLSGVIDGKPVDGYPPFTWMFGQETQGATLIGLDNGRSGMEFYGASSTVGVAAAKLVAPKSATLLRWRIDERSPNLQSSATWIATCIAGRSKGEQRTSVNLLGQSAQLKKSLTMQLPGQCDLIRLDMRIIGGIGRNPASLIVSDLALTGSTGRR